MFFCFILLKAAESFLGFVSEPMAEKRMFSRIIPNTAVFQYTAKAGGFHISRQLRRSHYLIRNSQTFPVRPYHIPIPPKRLLLIPLEASRFWFEIVWRWRSISCFRLLASLPYMSTFTPGLQ
jgi:hypothetical protein